MYFIFSIPILISVKTAAHSRVISIIYVYEFVLVIIYNIRCTWLIFIYKASTEVLYKHLNIYFISKVGR